MRDIVAAMEDPLQRGCCFRNVSERRFNLFSLAAVCVWICRVYVCMPMARQPEPYVENFVLLMVVVYDKLVGDGSQMFGRRHGGCHGGSSAARVEVLL